MAARKSCTKLTWGEAKNRSGCGNKNPNKATIKSSQQPNHGKLLAAKLIAKSGPDENERVKNRQAARFASRDQMRQEELDRRHEAKKEQQRLEAVARPHEMALNKLKEVEAKFWDAPQRRKTNNTNAEIESDNNDDDQEEDNQNRWNLVCESKQLQLDEFLALDAIYTDMDILKISKASKLDELQVKLDDWQMDTDQIDLQQAVVQHPTLNFTLTRSVEDPEDDDWVAHTLIHVIFPSDYPLERTPPTFRILWFLVTKKSLVVSSNKLLESLGILDEEGLLKSMSNEAKEFLLGMSSVYELLDTWLSERLFEFIQCPSREKK